MHPPRRSSPAISRFCPTLGWLNLVKSVSHRAAAHVALAAPIVLYDMWSRAEDNVLVQTISTKIRLNSYNPDLDVFWNLVAEEIPGRLPQQCRACYMPAAFLAQLTWGFCAYLLAEYRAHRPVHLMTAVLKAVIPRPYATRSHMHTGPLVIATSPSLWLIPPRD